MIVVRVSYVTLLSTSSVFLVSSEMSVKIWATESVNGELWLLAVKTKKYQPTHIMMVNTEVNGWILVLASLSHFSIFIWPTEISQVVMICSHLLMLFLMRTLKWFNPGSSFPSSECSSELWNRSKLFSSLLIHDQTTRKCEASDTDSENIQLVKNCEEFSRIEGVILIRCDN